MRSAEAVFGAPQDVEWTVSDGRLVLLQSRPVTTSTAGEGDKRAWYLSLTRSLDNLRGLRKRVEDERLPAMDREADAIAARDPAALDADGLAAEIERRRAAHDRWVDIYWQEFIPLAHGIRLFGQFYNDAVRPDDPYEFMGLLAATPMLSVRRNAELARLASRVRGDCGAARRSSRTATPATRPSRAISRPSSASSAGPPSPTSPASATARGCSASCSPWLMRRRSPSPPPRPTSGGRPRPSLTRVTEDRRELARELLDLGRASYRIRDDDNIHLARLETLVLEAVEEGRRRLRDRHGDDRQWTELEDVVRALRNPNLVVEPVPVEEPPAVEKGFRAQPRQLVGQPAGPGVATGPARVIEDVDGLFEFEAGEVIICDAIDPNMTFIVPMASAVVERRGGMLIHGAIIAREYGLPCVTGVPNVTDLVSTGDRLTVDGYLGIVTVLGTGGSPE